MVGSFTCGPIFIALQSAVSAYLAALYNSVCLPNGVSLANQQVQFYFSNSDIDPSHQLQAALASYTAAVAAANSLCNNCLNGVLPNLAICDIIADFRNAVKKV